MEDQRLSRRLTDIPEPLKLVWISNPELSRVEAKLLDISSLGAKLEARGEPFVALRRSDLISIQGRDPEQRFSAMVVYVQPLGSRTLLGVFFNRPREQNKLAALLNIEPGEPAR